MAVAFRSGDGSQDWAQNCSVSFTIQCNALISQAGLLAVHCLMCSHVLPLVRFATPAVTEMGHYSDSDQKLLNA